MGIFLICRDLSKAEQYVGVIAEYIDLPRSEYDPYKELSYELEAWINENLQGVVICIFEHECDKMYTVFLFQYKDDAVAFKLRWI